MKDERVPMKELLRSQDPLQHCVGTTDQILSRYQTCPLCSSRLSFTHITDFGKSTTHEVAKCPECKIKIREILHKLQ